MVSFQSLGCNISFWLSLTISFTQRTQRSQRGAAPVGLPVPIFHFSFFIMPFPDDVFHAKDATIAKGCRPVGLPVPIFHSSFFIMPFPNDQFHAKDATIAKRCRPRWTAGSHFLFFIFHYAFP
jgi:hypothetical protein